MSARHENNNNRTLPKDIEKAKRLAGSEGFCHFDIRVQGTTMMLRGRKKKARAPKTICRHAT